jgi:hypothetical protein
LSWCNSQFFCSQNLRRSLHTFSRSCHRSHSIMWNWLACQDELFMHNPLDVKENAFKFVLNFLLGGLLVWLRVIIINLTLITSDNPGQECCIIKRDLMKLLADIDILLFLISCQKMHQSQYMTPNQRTLKIKMSTQLREILYTVSKDMLVTSLTTVSHYHYYYYYNNNCCPGNYGYGY